MVTQTQITVRRLATMILAVVGSAACAASPGGGPQPPFRAVLGPVIIAHRGGSLEAPENTLAAIRHGAAVGSDWIEIDVTLSRDDEVIVIHDDTLERTTDGTGMVEAMTLSQ